MQRNRGFVGSAVSIWLGNSAINRNRVEPFRPPIITGGTLSSDATHYYNTFTESANFVIAQSNLLSSDILVIAGGGASGGSWAGGGGAGGLAFYESQALPIGTYAVTVGAGGAGVPGNVPSTAGSNGVNSSFGFLTPSIGGGRGGNTQGSGAAQGGSGGGGGYFSNNTNGDFGAGTAGQGNRGGSVFAGRFAGAGGGGASEVGANVDGTGKGGNGSSAYSSWGFATNTGQLISTTRWYAGGGSANIQAEPQPAGGFGGGGSSASGAANGLANTGGGGGGGFGGSGGSGIVIIRYARSLVDG
jgi:hypothetical protein